jgi:hypothetical protein
MVEVSVSVLRLQQILYRLPGVPAELTAVQKSLSTVHHSTCLVPTSGLEPHSAVYAALALPMEFPQNIHRQSAHNVRNDIHKFKKKILLHECRTESTVEALKWIVLYNRVACPTF